MVERLNVNSASSFNNPPPIYPLQFLPCQPPPPPRLLNLGVGCDGFKSYGQGGLKKVRLGV